MDLKQGYRLSPMLFNAFMEDLEQLLREHEKGVKCGDADVTHCYMLMALYYLTVKKFCNQCYLGQGNGVVNGN